MINGDKLLILSADWCSVSNWHRMKTRWDKADLFRSIYII